MTDLDPADLSVLTQWDTPTICNALEIVVPERRGHGFTGDAWGAEASFRNVRSSRRMNFCS